MAGTCGPAGQILALWRRADRGAGFARNTDREDRAGASGKTRTKRGSNLTA